MLLNGAALESLEVLTSSEGGTSGSLLSVLDHCVTPFGRRRLRQWLCRPLFRVDDIVERQDAVEVLAGAVAEAAAKARRRLAGAWVCFLEWGGQAGRQALIPSASSACCPASGTLDLEKALVHLHPSSSSTHRTLPACLLQVIADLQAHLDPSSSSASHSHFSS